MGSPYIPAVPPQRQLAGTDPSTAAAGGWLHGATEPGSFPPAACGSRVELEAGVRVGLVSLDQRWEDKAVNLRSCREFAAAAAQAGAGLVVFPEMTLTGFTMNAPAMAEDPETSGTVASFAEIASQNRVVVAFGVVLRGRTRPRNTLVVLDADGNEAGRYAKVHPFTYAREHEHYEGGDEPVVARVGGVSLGLTVCYDLRFPELYAALAPCSDVLLVIANWPARRIAHWHALLVARAIESQCFVIAVNRTGRDANGVEYPRSSVVVAPDGSAVGAHASDGALDLYDLDIAEVARYRQRFPVLLDRRPDVYRRLRG